ncbi:DUF3370 family protein [Synechococcales cyanobacterium C]|uniref:DUF3370 family protein n=1 Tax=Petrachloros mirabilis ULC683 TaxID=2781853 RepID=A0A8K1ZX10_9CYAN|nr:DUF3370 domain-containing protein [Petrachloros mirabilis]NCJ05591.1 DUF3370 family protein [Petrachloros mirabilis ULC683]
MLSLFASVVLAQKPILPSPQPIANTPESERTSFTPEHHQPGAPRVLQEFIQPQEVRALPGELDTVPVFNSNSPEVVRQSGILLSTFPPQGKRHPQAHLNYPFRGRFDVFAHHVARADRPDDTPTIYNGILLYNPSRSQSVTIDILQAASFLGTPDAPFVSLPTLVANDLGRVFSGPGSRVVDQVLRGQRQTHWPARMTLRPGHSEMLINLPIPVPRTAAAQGPVRGPQALAQSQNNLPRNTATSSNARSTLARLHSNGPVYIASMSMIAPRQADGTEGIPTKQDWERLLVNGSLLSPRDIAPSPLRATSGSRFFYGRVAGVSRGSQWTAQVTDGPGTDRLTIPRAGEAFSYGLSTLQRGTFGTGQIQSAPMIARYPDTAYLAHGNYGVHYNLAMPLHNPSPSPQTVTLSIQTPIKQDIADRGLRFLRAPNENVFFRGTVRVRYRDDQAQVQQRYFHIVQHRGQQGDPLITVTLQPGERRLVMVDYLYPPDATPPQVLTVQTRRS